MERQGPAHRSECGVTRHVEDLDRTTAEQYIGGLGLGTKYLYDEVDPDRRSTGPGQ